MFRLSLVSCLLLTACWGSAPEVSPSTTEPQASKTRPDTKPRRDKRMANVQVHVEHLRMVRDLSAAFADKWSAPAHQQLAERTSLRLERMTRHIQQAEGAEGDSPAAVPGTYEDPKLQSRYDAALAKGLASEADALRMGADLLDGLLERLSPDEDEDAGPRAHRMACSTENHLRVYLQAMADAEVTWEPTHLSAEQVRALRTSEPEACREGRGRQGTRGRRGKGGAPQPQRLPTP